MDTNKPTVDAYAKYARESLWVMLIVLALVALMSIGLGLAYASGWSGQLRGAPVLVPLMIIMVAGWGQSRRKRLGVNTQGTVWRAMFADEFRQQSLARAVRSALILVLVLQLPLAFAVDTWLAALGPYFMGYLTMLTGAIAVLGFFLFYGRDDA